MVSREIERRNTILPGRVAKYSDNLCRYNCTKRYATPAFQNAFKVRLSEVMTVGPTSHFASSVKGYFLYHLSATVRLDRIWLAIGQNRIRQVWVRFALGEIHLSKTSVCGWVKPAEDVRGVQTQLAVPARPNEH